MTSQPGKVINKWKAEKHGVHIGVYNRLIATICGNVNRYKIDIKINLSTTSRDNVKRSTICTNAGFCDDIDKP